MQAKVSICLLANILLAMTAHLSGTKVMACVFVVFFTVEHSSAQDGRSDP